MPSKRSLIVALVGLNLVLLAAVILSSYELPPAHAQGVGAGGNYITLTCEADQSYDVLYVIDLPNRTMHAYLPGRQLDGKLTYMGYRNLEQDCRSGQ